MKASRRSSLLLLGALLGSLLELSWTQASPYYGGFMTKAARQRQANNSNQQLQKPTPAVTIVSPSTHSFLRTPPQAAANVPRPAFLSAASNNNGANVQFFDRRSLYDESPSSSGSGFPFAPEGGFDDDASSSNDDYADEGLNEPDQAAASNYGNAAPARSSKPQQKYGAQQRPQSPGRQHSGYGNSGGGGGGKTSAKKGAAKAQKRSSYGGSGGGGSSYQTMQQSYGGGGGDSYGSSGGGDGYGGDAGYVSD